MPIKLNLLQSAVGWLIERVGMRNVVFEVTQRCNQSCGFCYNVWKCGDYPEGELDTAAATDILDRIITGYRPYIVTLTGGEPLLRPDIVDLVRVVSKRRVNCNLITNGTLMTDKLAADLVKAGVKTFEFTLLSADRKTHNELVGKDSFDQLIEAMAAVRAAGGQIATTFVAMQKNISGWADTLELNVAMGVSGILFNRFNIGGAGIAAAAELVPSITQLEEALAVADEGVSKYGISISCGVPIPPCIIDQRRYKNIHFPDCAVGTKNAYPTVDSTGNVRPCNHSATILGNLFEVDFRKIMSGKCYSDYSSTLPDVCAGCEHLSTCRGGCRAAAEVCGNACGIDPFVSLSGGRK